MTRLHYVICAVALAFTTPLLAAQQPAAETQSAQQIRLKIAAQPMREALASLAAQTGLQLIFPSDIAQDLKAPAVEGSYSPRAALDLLLANSGLQQDWINVRTVAIRVANVETSSVSEAGSSLLVAQSMQKAGDESNPVQATHPMGDSKEIPESEIVVTGTHIRGVAPAGSPLQQVSRRDLEQSGVSTVEQYLRKLPQNFASVDQGSYLNAVGGSGEARNNLGRGSSINLRGLGASSTLVLLNGHRMAPVGGAGQFADVSMIPLSAIARIDVLGDGASAIYGSDAIGGVVNFVLNRNFEGAETNVRYGEATQGGGEQRSVSQSVGISSAAAGAMLTYEYADQQSIKTDQRDFLIQRASPTDISPWQKKNSFFFSGYGTLDSKTQVSMDALYSDRNYSQTYISSNGISQISDTGSVSGGLVNASVARKLGAEWRAEILASYADADEHRSETVDGIPQGPFLNRSKFVSGGIRADGPAITLPAGTARISIGGDYRREIFRPFDQTPTTKYQRKVESAFAELYVPIAAGARGLHRLDASIAGRFDRYNDIGSSTTPKFGLSYQPVDGLILRGSYARSFRAPLLSQLAPVRPTYFTFLFPNTSSPSGVTDTLVKSASFNPDLKPERSTSYTFGADLQPAAIPQLNLSLTYFNILFKDRASGPPLVGSPFSVFSQLAAVGSYVNLNPDPAAVQAIFADNTVSDLARRGAAGVQAIFDTSPQNLNSSLSRGIDFLARMKFDAFWGEMDGSFNANYLLRLNAQPTPISTTVQLLNTTFNPPEFRLRSGINWMRGGWSLSVMANYTDSYVNTLVTPSGKVGSWTTADAQVAWNVAGSVVALTIDNVTDAKPPFLNSTNTQLLNLGFDGTNASAIGRFMSISLRHRW